MRFCGMVNFYHKSIPRCSSLLKPLYDIMREYRSKPKSSVISWLTKLEKCFVSVKDALSRKTVLSYPIPNAPTFLATDASDSCIAATLYQLHPVRNERVPLAFFSRNLQKAELKYSIFDKEVLAIYCSIKHFRYMLELRSFKILCDNQAVVQSLTKKNTEKFSARVLRHLQYISQFSTDCEYISSEENSAADALTRTGVALVHDLTTPLDFIKIADAQSKDPEIQAMCKQISSLQIKGLPVDGTDKMILCDVSQADPRVLLPTDFRRKAFDIIHSLSHAGIKSTTYMMKQKYIWPNLRKDVKQWVSQCQACQAVKTKHHTHSSVQSYPPPNQAFDELNIDIIGPLPPSKGYKYILTVTDRFTKGCFQWRI